MGGGEGGPEMMDWYTTMVASDYRRDALLTEAQQERRADRAARDRENAPSRPGLLGVLVAAMIALVATGAIAPR